MFVGNVNMLNNMPGSLGTSFCALLNSVTQHFFFGGVLKWYFSKGEHLGEHCSFYTIIIFLIEIS